MPGDTIDPARMAATHAAAFTQARPWSTAEFSELLESPFCFTCGDDRAFALVRVIADEAELLTIATHPDAQRRGLARACMQRCMTRATTQGAARAFLEVAADNTPAIALYQAFGFAPCGQRRGYYARPGRPAVDAIVMARDLP